MTPVVGGLVVLGVLLVVPIGLPLAGGESGLRRAWSAAAAPAAVSIWLPRGAIAACCVVPSAMTALLLAARIGGRIRRGPPGIADLAAATALVSPTVAAGTLVAERAGYAMFGFRLEVLALTVAHFLYAGFAASLIAGLACRAGGRAWPAMVGGLSVPGGIGLVVAGYFTGDWVELAGAALLTSGVWLVCATIWRHVRPAAPPGGIRALFTVAAVCPSATMLMALIWALGEATGTPTPSIVWMSATHGLGNAVGFSLCGLAAFRLAGEVPL